MRYVVTVSLLIAAVIHLLPLVGVVGPARLSELYGISVSDPNLEILMRHRAVLFGVLGVFLAFAAFNPAFQVAGFLAGFLSVASFLLIASTVGHYNAELSRVFVADLVALITLLVGAFALALARRTL